MNRFLRALSAPLSVLALCLVATQPWWRLRAVCSDDLSLHVLRTVQLESLLRQGVLYSRWAPDMGLGYGYPLPNFYAPLAYYVAASASLLTGSVQQALVAIFALAPIAAGLAMYGLARDYFSPRSALVATVAYAYAPYLAYDALFRGNLGENVIEDVPENLIKEVNDELTERYIRGVIDLGTNSCRLFAAEVEVKDGKKNIKRKYEKDMEICRLGEDVDKNGYLLPEAMGRTVEVLRGYREKLRKYGACEVLVYATSATRDSSNRDKFIHMVKLQTGMTIDCISGDKEANLSFEGAIKEIDGRVVLIDIGGGSTEIVKGSKKEIEFLKSFDVGAVRVTEKFFPDGNYTMERVDQARRWIEEVVEEIKEFSKEDFVFTGVAGTVTTHVSVAEKMEKYDSEKVHHYKLSKEQIEENLALFLSVDLEKRKKIKGLHEKRANVIIGGSLVLLGIMEVLGKEEILVSEDDILDGMMEE